MEKREIEITIRKYVRDNYTQHPGAFPNILTEIIKLSKILAISYWEQRDHLQVQRDKQAGVTIEDYQTWCVEELARLKKFTFYN